MCCAYHLINNAEVIKTENDCIMQFHQAVAPIEAELKKRLMSIGTDYMKSCREIRIIANQPVSLYCGCEHLYLDNRGGLNKSFENAFRCTERAVNDTYLRACRYSVHTYHTDIVRGFITIAGGHRIGLCGTAAADTKGNIISVRNISSLNIRISREIVGCADKILSTVNADKINSFIIVGPPSSGKTTVLRDIVRALSDTGCKVSLIDERNEIACTENGVRLKNVGVNTDVFNSYPKESALSQAVRSMSPDYIAVDEVCDDCEIRAIEYAANCGVRFIATVHASDYSEIISRKQIAALVYTNAFNKIVLLGANPEEGKFDVFDADEVKNEILRRNSDMELHNLCRL